MAIVERPEPAKRESAERPIRIFLNEVPVAVSQGSPFGLSELAVGYLLSEGLIADRDSLVEVVEVPEEAAVYVASGERAEEGYVPLHRVTSAGCAQSALLRAARRAGEPDLVDEMAEAGEGVEHIHRLCEQDRCGCDDADEDGADEDHAHEGAGAHGAGHARGCACGHGHDHGHSHGHGGVASIVRSALSHTIQVTAFIFVTTLILVVVLETVGEDALATLLSANKGLAVFAAALVGLVPNCAASVVVTQLYLEGVLGFGPLMAGTLVAAGVGFLVLFRANRNVRENLVILAVLFAAGVLWGLFFSIV